MLGGVSYVVAAGSINSREIENGTVQSRDVRDGALRGIDVKDRSLGGADLADNTLGDREINEPELDVQRLGGVDARLFVKNVRRVQTRTPSDPGTPKSAPPARCPAGKRVIGGGARIVAAAPVPVALTTNAPSGDGWEASAYATAPTGNWQLVAVAICG